MSAQQLLLDYVPTKKTPPQQYKQYRGIVPCRYFVHVRAIERLLEAT